MENKKGQFVPDYHWGQWHYIDENLERVLIVCRNGGAPWIHEEMILNLRKEINKLIDNPLYIFKLRGIFLDDKNGNIGSAHVDIYISYFLSTKDVLSLMEPMAEDKINCLERNYSNIEIFVTDEHFCHFHMHYKLKKISHSDGWNINCENEYKDAMENIIWKK